MHTFTTPTPITAHLDLPAGRIQLIATDRTDTHLEIHPADPASNRDVTAAQQTEVTHTDGTLRIQAPPAKNHLLGPSGAVKITLRLPAGSHLQATTTAELQTAGRLGEITLDTAHGPVTIDEAASAHLRVQAGDVTLGRLTGPAQIDAQQGDLHIGEAHHGTVVLTTRSGDITIGAAPGVSAALNAGTTLGRIHNTLTNTDGPHADLAIHATTDHGDITARSL